jgi:hypothetical protein
MSGVNSGWLLESLFFLLACNSRLYHHYAGCLLSMIVGISYFSFLPVWSRWACIYGAALNGRCFPAMSSLVSSSSVSSAHLHQVNKIRKMCFFKKGYRSPRWSYNHKSKQCIIIIQALSAICDTKRKWSSTRASVYFLNTPKNGFSQKALLHLHRKIFFVYFIISF